MTSERSKLRDFLALVFILLSLLLLLLLLISIQSVVCLFVTGFEKALSPILVFNW